jgi:hypothetical protein
VNLTGIRFQVSAFRLKALHKRTPFNTCANPTAPAQSDNYFNRGHLRSLPNKHLDTVIAQFSPLSVDAGCETDTHRLHSKLLHQKPCLLLSDGKGLKAGSLLD